jgi:hypothetical protein
MNVRAALFVGISCCAIAFAGCRSRQHSAPEAISPSNETAAVKAADQLPRARDACALVANDDVAAIYGSMVTSRSDAPASIFSTCEFVDPARSNIFVFGIEVYWQGGRDQWRAAQLGTSGAKRMLEHAEKEVDVGSILKQDAIAGLGDQAVFSELLGGHILKGDTMINFKFGLLPKPAEHFRALGEKALLRL